MANKEIYRIGIQVGVDGVEDSKQKLSAMEKYTQQTEKRLKMLNKITVSPTAKLKDQTSSAIEKINVKSKSLSKALISPTAKINDQATSKLDRISTTIKKLENSNITATLRIKDQTDNYLNKVHSKSDKFKDVSINPTARISGHSSDINKIRSDIMDLDGEFRSANMSQTKYFDNMQEHSHRAGSAVTNNLSNISREMEHVGRGFSEEGDKFMMGITLPIMGLGAAAGKAGMDFDAQMSRVQAISGATGKEISQLHDQALQLGKDTAFSAKQAAEGMENLASAGFSTNEIMSAMPGLLNLAASSGESLANSSDIAASTLRGFGLEASQTGHVADVLAKNAAATNAAVADTGEAMKYIAPVAHAMGLGLEEVTAAIGEMSNSGIKGSQAGTTLRSALTRLASPSKEAADAMKSVGFNAFDSKGKLKSLSTVVDEYSKALKGKTDQQQQDLTATIFGQEAMSGMMVLMQGGSSALDELANSYKNADGAAEEMAKTMQDNSKSAIEQMTGSLETAAIKVEEAFSPLIISMANKVQDLANGFADLNPEQQMFYAKLLGAVAIIGPVMKFIGGLTGSISKLISVGSKLGPLLGITTASSAGIALGAVAALGIGIAGVQTHTELMSKSFDTSTDDLSAWEKAVNVLTGSTIKSKKELQSTGLAYEDFSKDLSGNFKNSVENASKSFNKLKMTLAFDSRNGVDFTDSMSADIKSQVDSIVTSAKEAVISKRGEMQSTLSQLFNLGDGKIDDNESKVIDNIAEYQDSKFQTIQTLNENIYNTLNTAVSQHKKLTEEDINNIKDWTQQIQALEIEASTGNESDRQYASNQGKFEKRLGSMTADEALSSMKDAYSQIININQDAEDKRRDIISKAQALEPELNDKYSKALATGDTAKAESLKKSIEAIKKGVTEAQDKLNDSVKERADKTKDLWDAFYSTNDNLKGKINEINFTKFSPADIKANGSLNSKLSSEYSEIANTTKTGMQRIKEADGWHDIEVNVDEATGKITSIYDTFNGSYAGYSEDFAQKAKASGDKVRSSMEELQKSLTTLGGGVKLDSNNDAINSSTGEIISKLDNVIATADGAKIAIANVDGKQIKLDFDKDGLLKNYDDVVAAINGDTTSKAIVNIDFSNKDSIMQQLQDVKTAEDGTKTGILDLNGTPIQITSNASGEIINMVGLKGSVDNIPPSKDVQIGSNANQATSEVNGTTNAVNKMPDSKTITITTIFKKITQWFDEKFDNAAKAINDHSTASSYTTTEQDSYDENRTRLDANGKPYATGTNNASTGWHDTAEKGFEIMIGRKKRWFAGGEKVLNHQQSKSFLQNLQNKETPNTQQNQFQLVKPQVKLAGVNVGDIQVNITGNHDTDGIVQEVVQVVGVKLKEALEDIK